MTRPAAGEWAVLGLDADPVPGDPEAFERIISVYAELASATEDAYDLLVRGGGQDAVRGLLGKQARLLDRMATSYRSAALAYSQYLPALVQAQQMSLRALNQASRARSDAKAMRGRKAAARQALDQAKSLVGKATVLRDAAARGVARNLNELAVGAPRG